jgi:hypothetical protein
MTAWLRVELAYQLWHRWTRYCHIHDRIYLIGHAQCCSRNQQWLRRLVR